MAWACVVPEDPPVTFEMFPTVQLQSGPLESNRGGREDSTPAAMPLVVAPGFSMELDRLGTPGDIVRS